MILATLARLALPAWTKYAALAALCAAIWGHGWVTANNAANEAAARLQAAQEAAQLANLVDEIRARESALSVLNEKLSRPAKVRTIEVTKYVTEQSDGNCIVPTGFVRLHRAATQGDVPEAGSAASGANEADSGIALSAVAAVDRDNYATCHEIMARYDGLKAWAEGITK